MKKQKRSVGKVPKDGTVCLRPQKSSFLGDFMTLGVGTLLYMVVGVIGTPIITRLVDPAAYGQMSMLTVYSNIGLMLCGLGLDQTMLRHFYQGDLQYQRKLLQVCCGISLLFAVILGSILLLVYANGARRLDLLDLILMELNVIVLLLYRFASLLLRLRTHTKAYSAVNLLQKSSYVLLTILLVFLIRRHHYVILAVATILSTGIAAVLAIGAEREVWRRPTRADIPPLKSAELLKYGFPIMLSSSITVLFNAQDKLFIEHYGTLSDVGIYAGAMNLMAVFSVVRTSFTAIWMPAVVEHYEQKPEDKTFYQRGNAFISILMLSFGAVVVLCKDWFVMLLGSRYQMASAVVPYLMFEPILYTISETTVTGIVVQKKPIYQIVVAAGSCLVNLIGNWLLVPLWGVQGAALSTGVSYVVFWGLRTMLSNRVFYVDYGLPGFFAALTALFLFAVYASDHSFSWISLVLFTTVMAVITLVYRACVIEAVHRGAAIAKRWIQTEKEKDI